MGGYSARVAELLGPYSQAQTWPALLREWFATGAMDDNGEAEEQCQVCGHEHIRYLFEIKNSVTGCVREKSGSKCILKFSEIGVLDGQAVTYDPVRKQQLLAEIVERHKRALRLRLRRETTHQVMAWLRGKNGPHAPFEAMRHIALDLDERAFENGIVTPKQFSLFVWAAQMAGVLVPMGAFQGCINLRRGKSKDQLESLRANQIDAIRGALTQSQLGLLEIHRRHHKPHAPPPRRDELR